MKINRGLLCDRPAKPVRAVRQTLSTLCFRAALAIVVFSGGRSVGLGLLIGLTLTRLVCRIDAAELPSFDFATVTDAQGWQAAHDIASLQQTPEGLRVQISGGDPYLYGPPRDYPTDTLLWLHLRLKSDQGGTCQVFYFGDAPSEPDSVRFSVPAAEWYDAVVQMPALGPSFRLRIDPPGSGGFCTLANLRLEERLLLQPPAWPTPVPPNIGANALTVQSGELKLVHSRETFGGFEVQVADKTVAAGHTRGLIGYLVGREQRWLTLGNCPGSAVTAQASGNGILVNARCVDPDGVRWEVQQLFTPGSDGTLEVESRVNVDQDRMVTYLPLFTLLPGLGSFGTNKTQAIFAGVEYLENEPSSSEADVIGPGSKRQVPDTLKITFPLMALAADERYVGLIWEPQLNLCAMFDSPDRLFGSAGHVMGILFPGSNGVNRQEDNLLSYFGERLVANQPLILRATLIGGRGLSVVPAVQQFVKLRGLPLLPSAVAPATDYFLLAARGWLDSEIRQGDLYRHAAPNFAPQPSSDAAVWMLWLAGKVQEPILAGRLTNAAVAAIAQVASQNYNGWQVGHVRYPLPALVYGAVEENATQAQAEGQARLGRFEVDGTVLYQPGPNGVDYGKTHRARDASGLTAEVVASLLEAAVFSGDCQLISDGLRYLRAMDKFRNTVPRGAQTWEIPLHTPDILASAHLVRAYTLGYELTGDTNLLEQARYWAWTGVPFVYLTPPTPRAVGLYATIPVFGATDWTAPLWIGLPVQWCGLVYGEALQRFAKYDPAGPWQQLAAGIALCGVQQTYPLTGASDQGLLPDSFNLRVQTRNPANINPATVLAPSVRAYGQPPVYEFRSFLPHGLLVHAPGEIRDVVGRSDSIKFTVAVWSQGPSYLLVNGVRRQPRVRIDDQEVPFVPPHQYQAAEGRLILRIEHSATVEIFYQPETGSLSFDHDEDWRAWALQNQIRNDTVSGGVLSFDITGSDPYMVSPRVCIDGTLQPRVQVRMRNRTAGTVAQIYWATMAEPVLDETKVINFLIIPNDPGFTTYTVELSGHLKWSNNIITTVRLDPVANVSSGRIEIDWISVNNSVNLAPSFAKGPDQMVNEDSGQHFLPNWAMNLSPGSTNETTQTLTFEATNDNAGLFAVPPLISRDGTLSYRLATNSNGNAIVTVRLRDNGGTVRGGQDTSMAQMFVIKVNPVNDPPSFIKGPDQTALEDSGPQMVVGWAMAIRSGPPDEASQKPTFLMRIENNSLFTDAPAIDTAGTLTYTPAPNASGVAQISVMLQDDGGLANGGKATSDSQRFTITILPVNDGPEFTKGVDQTALEDAGIQTISGWALVRAGPDDESSQTLTFQVSNNNSALFSAEPAISPAGRLTFTPAANANGTATLTISLTDSGGTANGGADTSAGQTFTITIDPVNDAPGFTKGADLSVLGNVGPQTVPGWATMISAGPPDESGQALTFEVSNDNNALFSARPAISADGTLTFTPARDTSGRATVTVTLRDDGGTANGGVDTSAPQTFTITVREPDPKIVLAASIDSATIEFKLMVTGVPGRNHLLQVSIDLRQWDTVAAFAPASGTFEYVGSATATTPFRFYRVMLEP